LEPRAEDKPVRRWRPGWRLLLLVAVVAAGLVLARTYAPGLQALRGMIEEAGPWAPLLLVLLQASRGVTWLPGNLLSPLAGILFGFWAGLTWSWIGIVGAAALGFAMVRWLGRSRERRADDRHGKFEALLRRAGGREWLALLLARLVPGIPFNVVSYLAAATTIRWPAYLAVSALGCLPRAAAQVAIGAGLYAAAG
jgi:uncharacterized membrane protein YdjX (TVP38/TMEM64 family)